MATIDVPVNLARTLRHGHTLQPDHCVACAAFHDEAKQPANEAA